MKIHWKEIKFIEIIFLNKNKSLLLKYYSILITNLNESANNIFLNTCIYKSLFDLLFLEWSVSSVSSTWVQFQICWCRNVRGVLFVLIERSDVWAGIWSNAPSDFFEIFSKVNLTFADSCSLAFEALCASVISVPVESLVKVAVVWLIFSAKYVFGPCFFFCFWIFIS